MDVNGANSGDLSVRGVMPVEPTAPVSAPAQAPPVQSTPVSAQPAPAAPVQAPVSADQRGSAPVQAPAQQTPPQSAVIVEEMRRRGFEFAPETNDDGFVTQVEQVWNENQSLKAKLAELNSQAQAQTPGPQPSGQQLPAVPTTPAAQAVAAPAVDEDPFAEFRVQPLSREAQSIAHLLTQDAKGFYRAENPETAAHLAPYIKEINDWAMKQNAVQKMLLQDPLGTLEKLSAPLVAKETKALREEVDALKTALTQSQTATESERINQEINANRALYFQVDPATGREDLTAFGRAYQAQDTLIRQLAAKMNHQVPESEIHQMALQAAKEFATSTPQAPVAQQQSPVPPQAAPQAAAPVVSAQASFLQRVAANPTVGARPAPPQEYEGVPPHRPPQDRFITRATSVRELLDTVGGYTGR